MARYESGDIVTYWFVVHENEMGTKQIQGYSDSKAMVKAYLDFHKCADFTIKGKTATIDEIVHVLNANANDEIQIINIATRDPDAKKGRNRLKLIPVPITGTEKMFLEDDTQNFLNSAIQYSYLNSAIPYLKDKWQRVLDDIMLTDVIRKVIHHQVTKRMTYLDIDQLMLLLRIPNSHFGL